MFNAKTVVSLWKFYFQLLFLEMQFHIDLVDSDVGLGTVWWEVGFQQFLPLFQGFHIFGGVE